MRKDVEDGGRPHQLEDIILGYLNAVDGGTAPAPEAVLAQHPELATELRLFFAEQARLGALLEPLRGRAPHPREAEATVHSIGDYEILGEIGRTGMSVVYKARQTSLNRLVALKIMAPERLPDTKLRARFRAEAQVVAQFDHPNIVRVYEAGEWEGRPWCVLELIPGGSLAAARPRSGWAPATAARLVAQLADAITYAHEKGVVHRDLKPANILLASEDVPKIADFGLSKQLLTDAAALTLPGDCLGTPAYMAPEQADARPDAVGPHTDIFGLGAILYDLLTGRAPFAGQTVLEVLREARRCHVVPPRQINQRVPAALERICMRALAPDTSKRYGSAADLALDLRHSLRRPQRLALAVAGVAVMVGLPWLALTVAAGVFRPGHGVRAADGAAPSSELALQARRVLEAHCYRCHGRDGMVEGGFNFVLDREQLVSRRGMVVPGNADKSRLFRRVRNGEMPPDGDGAPLSESDIAALRDWINADAPAFQAPEPPPSFTAYATVLQQIRDDLKELPARDHAFVRYFTITHLRNAGVAEDELQTYRHALAKLVNSLSWDSEITVPQSVDRDRTIFRIDLRHYRWSPGVWKHLLGQYPYATAGTSGPGQAIRQFTGCEVPAVRADWFVCAASRPPLYYELLQLPRTDRELERELGLDVSAGIQEERVARAGFVRSGVSQHNRVIERHKTGYGAFWKSYDFADSRDRHNILEHPLGPGASPNEFSHDGGEIIFNLPNGLQAYFLVDGAGSRLDRGPAQIVKDPRQGDGAVVNGISCMSCHVKGIIDKADDVRVHVQQNPGSFRGEADRILALYPPRERFAELTARDAERFARAVRQTGVPASNTDPIVALASRFEWDLDARLAAAELDLPTAEFLKRLDSVPPALARSIGLLKAKGGTIKRQVMENAFADLMRELNHAAPVSSPAAPAEEKEVINSIGMRLRLIPAGKFTMGSPAGETGRRPDETLHQVLIDRPFFLGVFEVTQHEYEKVLGTNPSGFAPTGADREMVRGLQTRRFPVERVSWDDAVRFCETLSSLPTERRAGRTYRLPTEIEWEYACRGGVNESMPFATGRTLTLAQGNFDAKSPDETAQRRPLRRPSEVGSYPPNGFGLHDMHGGVWEWCVDRYDPGTSQQGVLVAPAGPAAGDFRVLRGGSWLDGAKDCRSAVRHHSLSGYANHAYGFRILMTAVGK